MKKSNIEMMIKGLMIVKEALEAEMGTEVVEDAKVVDIKEAKANKESKKATKATKEVKEEVETDVEVESDNLAEELNGMSLKDLKEKAKELGVAVRGSKSAIIGRILEALDNAEDEEEVVEEEEVIETDDEQEDDVEVGDEVEEVDLEEALKDYSVEELAEMLAEAGLSTKGKKQALIAKVIKAVEEGKIEFGEDDEEDEEVEETVDATEEGIDLEEILSEVALKDLKAICKELGIKVTIKDKTASVIEKMVAFEDEDALLNTLIEKGIVEGDDIDEDDADVESDEIEIEGSEERVEAVTKLYEETMEEIENEEITIDEIKEFYEELLEGNKAELKKISKMDDEDLAQKYALMVANCIDDDCDEVEFNTPYLVGDKPYCCGQPMKKLKGNTYVCTIDGEEAEIEA